MRLQGSGNEGATSAFRPDIEGLRAIAVLLVVVYHARLGPFHGGLVGVDVFFVLSGFLITSLLIRELQTSSRISMIGFWARRAKRLLPASSVTVITTLLVARWMLAPLEFRSLGHDALAAAGFVINIVFMRRGNDYFAADSVGPSPLLHFWSLALEEQFYLVWPLLIALAARARRSLRAIGILIAVVVVVSFGAGVWYTKRSPITAFYVLPTRAWELGVGALLAVAESQLDRIKHAACVLLGWAGLAGVIVSSLVINDRTPFPGVAALLPVLSTAALIAAGSTSARFTPTPVLSFAPLQWIGKRSYAIYLWHWPAYALATARWGTLDNGQAALTMGVAIAIAAVSYSLIENPIRRDPWLAGRPLRPLALGGSLALVAAVLAIVTFKSPIPGGVGTATAPTLTPTVPVAITPTTLDAAPSRPSDPDRDPQPQSTTLPPPTTAYPSLDSLVAAGQTNLEASLLTKLLPSNVRPDIRRIRRDRGQVFRDGCILTFGSTDLGKKSCVYGDPEGGTTVALVGDSHAGHWFPGLNSVATTNGWQLHVLAKMGCPPEDINRFRNANLRPDCLPWRDNVMKRLKVLKPDLIIVSHFRYNFRLKTVAQRRGGQWEELLTMYFRELKEISSRVVFLEDVPTPPNFVPSCLLRNRKAVNRCTFSPTGSAIPELRESEKRAALATGIAYVPTYNWFCTEQRCAVLVGDLLLYADDNHITNEAARYFAPFLEASLVPLLQRIP